MIFLIIHFNVNKVPRIEIWKYNKNISKIFSMLIFFNILVFHSIEKRPFIFHNS